MKITIDRPDLCTKRQMKNMLEKNYLEEDSEYNKGFNEAIRQIIKVMERDL